MGANQGGEEPRLFVPGAGGLNDPAVSVPQRDNSEARRRGSQGNQLRSGGRQTKESMECVLFGGGVGGAVARRAAAAAISQRAGGMLAARVRPAVLGGGIERTDTPTIERLSMGTKTAGAPSAPPRRCGNVVMLVKKRRPARDGERPAAEGVFKSRMQTGAHTGSRHCRTRHARLAWEQGSRGAAQQAGFGKRAGCDLGKQGPRSRARGRSGGIIPAEFVRTDRGSGHFLWIRPSKSGRDSHDRA